MGTEIEPLQGPANIHQKNKLTHSVLKQQKKQLKDTHY